MATRAVKSVTVEEIVGKVNDFLVTNKLFVTAAPKQELNPEIKSEVFTLCRISGLHFKWIDTEAVKKILKKVRVKISKGLEMILEQTIRTCRRRGRKKDFKGFRMARK
jgi:hypothetical protein